MELKTLLNEFHGATSSDDARDMDSSLNMQFRELARHMICGGYIEVSSLKMSRRIYVDDIEFYYHEEAENPNGIKDPIVYHRNHLKPELKNDKRAPYFKIGQLNLHQSGIDIAFENKERHYRASALIRGYRVDVEGKTIPYSTHLYDDLFSGFALTDGIAVKWVDKESLIRQMDPQPYTRQNVKKYDRFVKTSANCDRPWRYKVKPYKI